MRVVIAEDQLITRVGLGHMLRQLGHEVLAEVGNADELLATLESVTPDAVVVDIRMPPTYTDEGLVAAEAIGRRTTDVRVLVLSQYVESSYAMRLLQGERGGLGYLLKERVFDPSVLGDALDRLAIGECVIDPEIATRLVNRRRVADPLAALTPREREVLAQLAEGHSNAAIARELFMSERTVEAHTTVLFQKLGIAASPDNHRRVQAVLAYLRSDTQGASPMRNHGSP
jgi:DNA-binding NarL/FixJ family response regulator